MDDAAVNGFGRGEIGLRRHRARQLHGNQDLSGFDAVGLAIFRGGHVQERLALLGVFVVEGVGGAGVIEVADQTVRIEGIGVALEQFLAVLLDLFHVGLFALGVGEIDLRQLDDGIPMIGLIGGNQFHRLAQCGHGAAEIARLDTDEGEFVVRRSILRIAFQSVPVLDGSLFVATVVEIFVAALQVALLHYVGIATARRQSQENCHNDRD